VSVVQVTASVVADRAAAGRVAVALNGEVVPRSRWETTDLAAGDSLEVLAPTAGG
jgi:sulfur carrier protein